MEDAKKAVLEGRAASLGMRGGGGGSGSLLTRSI